MAENQFLSCLKQQWKKNIAESSFPSLNDSIILFDERIMIMLFIF